MPEANQNNEKRFRQRDFCEIRGQHVVPPNSEQLRDPGSQVAKFQTAVKQHFGSGNASGRRRVVIQLELEEVVNRSMAQPLRMRFTQVRRVRIDRFYMLDLKSYNYKYNQIQS